MTIDQVGIYRYRLPLRYALPLKGTQLSVREGFIVELRSGQRFGYGDAAPLADFSGESLTDVFKQLQLIACSCQWPDDADRRLWSPSVAFAMQSALWSLQQQFWLAPPSQAPLLQGDTSDILKRLRLWDAKEKPSEVKLKIGNSSLSQDVQRIGKVLDALPNTTRLRLDANQRWSYPEALRVGQQLDAKRIAYIEEPTSDPGEFELFYQATGIPVALDETVQRKGYVFRSFEGLAAIILKPTLVGGLNRCFELIESCRTEGIRTVFSSTFESSVGIHTLEQLSARWTPDELPGLDTVSAFASPLVEAYSHPGQRLQLNSNYITDEYYFPTL